MTRHTLTAALVTCLAAVAVLAPLVMDGPTELDAIQSTADSVIDAEQAATTFPLHLTAQARP